MLPFFRLASLGVLLWKAAIFLGTLFGYLICFFYKFVSDGLQIRRPSWFDKILISWFERSPFNDILGIDL